MAALKHQQNSVPGKYTVGRKMNHKGTLLSRIGVVLVVFGAVTLLQSFAGSRKFNPEINTNEDHEFTGRKLLQTIFDESNDTLVITPAENCTPRSVEQFPADFMTLEQKLNGGIVFHIVLVIYIFASLAIVCDDYFVASLEKICTVMKLQPDVAGATFMAAGSSAPELFTSIVGVFFAKSDVGLGTIVGSAVFNILFIIAICGLFSGMVIYLTWWPLFRDSLFYLISIITLVGVIYDNQVTWYESMIMLLLYVLYIILMYFNPRLGDYMIAKGDSLKLKYNIGSKTKQQEEDNTNEKSPLLGDTEQTYAKSKTLDLERANQKPGEKGGNTGLPVPEYTYQNAGEKEESVESQKSQQSVYSDHVGFERSGQVLPLHDDKFDDEGVEEYVSPFSFPSGIGKRIFWVIMLPVSFLLFFTVPDCRRPGCWQKTFALTFTMSVVWIAAMSYIMVWMVTIVGDTLGIPDTVMGLTFLAAGTSVPDALASLFVAKDGYGDMAVSNSIGSNVFDILMCLGLPWLLQTTVVASGEPLEIGSKGLIFTTFTLFGTVVFLVVSLGINGWKLNKKFGVLLIVIYVIVITFSCLYELNVFSFVNLPVCPRS